MEAHADGGCRVVYFCAVHGDGRIHELHHHTTPIEDTPTTAQQTSSALHRLRAEVRGLLDPDLGGFEQVFVSSRAEECLEQLESWANSTSVVVLIEFHNVSHDGAVSASFLKDESGSYAFLRALTVDIQGARYQKHVMPFAVLTDDDSDSEAPVLRDFITSSCLDAGAIDAIKGPLQVEGITRVVGHVQSMTRPRAHLLGAQMAQNLVDSIRDISEPAPAKHRPDKILSSTRIAVVEAAVCSWRFPAQDLNMDELTYAALFMVEHILRVPELQPYGLPRARLMAFILATRRQYKHSREVFYHNWRHAVDVTQSIFYFLLRVRLCPSLEADTRPVADLNPVEQLLTHLDGLILLVSAVGHDVGHPGVNNAFLVACNHPLAQMYNDKSVLENYHGAAYSQLLRRHWPSLGNISGFRSTMISTILATDMQRHFEYMSRLGDFAKKVHDSDKPASGWPDKEREQARELLMSLILKAADISNVARPFEISADWAKILMEEFARQGELESELRIPTCLFGGPPNKEDALAAAESQKGFMNLFGTPLFRGIAEIMPSLSCAVSELDKNQKIWDQRIETEKQRREGGENEPHLTFSSVTASEVNEAIGKHKSEPMVLPLHGPTASASSSTPSTPRRNPVTSLEPSSPSRHLAHEHRRPLSSGVTFDESQRASMPLLGPGAMHHVSPLSASSRRSSKDIALDQLQQLSAIAQQNIMPGSRRGSADAAAAGWQVHQSYPSSRRGSKDESLTTILVTSGAAPGRRGSPLSPTLPTPPAPSASPIKSSVPKSPPTIGAAPLPQQPPPSKDRATRNSVPSSRSNATSTATVMSAAQRSSSSTQPSSLAGEEDDDSSNSNSNTSDPAQPAATAPPARLHHEPSDPISSTEDPFVGAASWPNDPADRFRRTPVLPDGTSDPGGRLPASPPPPPLSLSSLSSAGGAPKSFAVDGEDPTPGGGCGKAEAGGGGAVLRESRSRSRLRGLRFWRKRREVAASSEISGEGLPIGEGALPQPP